MKQLYHLYIEPRATDIDARRREFILNTLLAGLLVLGFGSCLITVSDFFVTHRNHRLDTVVLTILFLTIIGALLAISRKGKPQVAAIIFFILLMTSSTYFVAAWGVRLAQAELLFALTIVIAGVLFSAPIAITATLLAAALLLTVAGLQVNGTQVAYTAWENEPLRFADAVGYVVIFIVMGIVSWLANRETGLSLKRAQASEAALALERDNLERKVIERTKELEQLQAARLLELQPFAEFGRIGASLVHEIANPLTAATLHLEALNKEQHSVLVRHAQRSLNQLDKYLTAARKQIKRESELKTFNVGSEIKQIVRLLSHRAHKAEVHLQVHNITGVKLYGDVVKFDQAIANLVANAIDASAGRPTAVVALNLSSTAKEVTIAVTDFGTGITATNIDHIFEPFYSTKGNVRSGLGIGLAMVKQYVEADFSGRIAVTSSLNEGTTFTVTIPLKLKRNT